MEGLSYGVVGQEGFFDKFKVIFDYPHEEVELRPLNSAFFTQS